MILFFTTYPDTFNNPTILGLLEKLAEKEITTKVIVTYNIFPNPFKNVELIKMPWLQSPGSRFNLKKVLKQSIKLVLVHIQLVRLAYKLKPKIIIGIDADGLMLGRIIHRYSILLNKKGAQLDLLSFEILFKNEGAEKKNEIRASKYISNIIIQDSLRERLIRDENKIRENVRSFYIPVAPLLTQKRNEKSLENKDSIRQKYHLPDHLKLIVHFGSFENWSGAEWIISAIEKGLPNNIALIIHSRYKFNNSNYFQNRIMELAATDKQLIISEEYIENHWEVLAFLSQFDAGLTFYVPNGHSLTGMNMHNIGYSSGKFSYYMAAGIPVIASSLPSYKDLNSNFNFGFTVDNEKQFLDLLYLNPDFEILKPNCKKLFKEILEPSYYINEYISSLPF